MRPLLRVLLLAAGCADRAAEIDTNDGRDTDGAGDTDPGDTDAEGAPCREEPVRDGIATWYDADGSGACGFAVSAADPLLVGAMNLPDWAGAEVCGACAHLVGPQGEVTVEIVDQCPECGTGHIDLSPSAFEAIAPLVDGRVDITWSFVACDVDGPITWAFIEGSNEWWMAVQPRGTRYAVTSLEVRRDGAWEPLARQDWNYFVGENLGPGPFDLRLTDVNGQVVEDDGVNFVDGGTVPGDVQLPECAP